MSFNDETDELGTTLLPISGLSGARQPHRLTPSYPGSILLLKKAFFDQLTYKEIEER